jgi:hypothetical protein
VLLQDKEQTRGIVINVLGPPLLPPQLGISYSKDIEASGPIVPVRFCDTLKGAHDLAKRANVLATLWEEGGHAGIECDRDVLGEAFQHEHA